MPFNPKISKLSGDQKSNAGVSNQAKVLGLTDRNVIKVVLDYPNLPHRPGDLICGNISGLPSNGRSIESVQLEITGLAEYCVSNAVSGLDKEKRPVIFGWTAQIFTACFLSGTCSIPPPESGDSRWRFAITVPESTLAPGYNTKVGGSTFNEPSAGDTNRGRFITWPSAHSLPPTMPQAYGEMPNAGLPRFADVRYALSVRTIKQGGKVVPVTERGSPEKTNFWLMPLCAENEMLPSPKMAWTRRGNTNFVMRTSASFRRKGFPKEMSMRVSVNAPNYVHIGDIGEMNFDVGMEVRRKAELEKITATKISMTIESLDVELEQEWCGYGQKLETFTNIIAKESAWLGPTTCGRRFSHTEDGTAYSDAEIRCVPGLFRRSVTPDFASWHLSLRHRLHFKFEFVCLGNRASIQVSMPIRVLPKPRRPADLGLTDGFVQGPQNVEENWGDPTMSHQKALKERDKISNVTKQIPPNTSAVVTGSVGDVADMAQTASSCSIM